MASLHREVRRSGWRSARVEAPAPWVALALQKCYTLPMEKRLGNTSDIGSVLRRRREELGKSAKDLAETIGVPRSTLLRIEKGQASPTWGIVLALSQALELQPVLVPREKMPAVDAVVKMSSDAPEAPPMAGEEWD